MDESWHANKLFLIVVKATLWVLILVYSSSEIPEKLPKQTSEILERLRFFRSVQRS